MCNSEQTVEYTLDFTEVGGAGGTVTEIQFSYTNHAEFEDAAEKTDTPNVDDIEDIPIAAYDSDSTGLRTVTVAQEDLADCSSYTHLCAVIVAEDSSTLAEASTDNNDACLPLDSSNTITSTTTTTNTDTPDNSTTTDTPDDATAGSVTSTVSIFLAWSLVTLAVIVKQ
uniref:Cell wall protein IFF6-like n=1 Tax=Saccoglossus kowalevskii TaxID=10224 RepID=A0ABM0MHU0_SACKO|nr:PREDICTED: cell wall protein IFF6-like [Saccoglossus kowalevskii]